MVHEIESFYGVYCLYCLNPRYKGHTYIGFTVDPNRRVQQHNRGRQAGGACRTSGRGPWEMVLIIHGFPNKISALRFEWAWQNPKKSRRLRHLTGKQKSETGFEFKFRIVSEMLRTAPWTRLPLIVRWLKQDYCIDFNYQRVPPLHMAIVYGPVISKKVNSIKGSSQSTQGHTRHGQMEETESLPTLSDVARCFCCKKKLKTDSHSLRCLAKDCCMQSHMLCLAQRFLCNSPLEIIPVEGDCPSCGFNLLWGHLIRQKMGCYDNNEQAETSYCADQSEDSE